MTASLTLVLERSEGDQIGERGLGRPDLAYALALGVVEFDAVQLGYSIACVCRRRLIGRHLRRPGVRLRVHGCPSWVNQTILLRVIIELRNLFYATLTSYTYRLIAT
jgi:hypothetical protein